MTHAFQRSSEWPGSCGDILPGFELANLMRSAASAGPDRLAMTDSTGESVSFAALAARVDAMAGHLTDLGLAPGETIMISGAACVSTTIAVLAGLDAGLDVALAPLHPPVAALAAFAARTGASAILSHSSLGEYAPMEDMFEAAARTTCVRILCSIGPGLFDGAVDISGPYRGASHEGDGRASRIATFAPGGAIVWHEQRTLALAAIDLAHQAHIGLGEPILSMLAPVSFAGLVAGPFLAAITDSQLHLLGPFRSNDFVAAIARLAPAHVIAPGALAGPLAEAGVLRRDVLASLLLLDRTGEARGALAPIGVSEGVAIVDLHAFGEQALIAECRGADSRPLPPARTPHMIEIGGRSILAARRRAGPGPVQFEGEAVSAVQERP